ncbi:ankyrin repeat domain-containing protein [Fuerstiella marisgermanici]|uniref:Ankyrin repeat protein n=1 Tax=Fuerstiella marisgermanici TaxID=1891926 RepID=A0A1P8WRZ9_9PLAN|nr:ankyrin repeat domain-containing protein [Fuerstiella marisgermanici]APZ96836.1 ankyrin repeat protein [Fuerstiella marisgermanici]
MTLINKPWLDGARSRFAFAIHVMFAYRLALCILALNLSLSSIGCSKPPIASISAEATNWHAKFGWKATDYFDDPQVIALCEAIEENDIAEIDRLIGAGADVNAKGKGNMTPLLWAFPDNKLKRFVSLLEHGADPNVVTKSEFGVRSAFHVGDSVTHMASRSAFPKHFEAVMKHGGDPQLFDTGKGDTLLHAVITSRAPHKIKKERIQLLIEKGADLNAVDASGNPPVTDAVAWFGQFDIASQLLKAGADYGIYQSGSNSKLVHIVERAGLNLHLMGDDQRQDFKELEAWLKNAGEDLEAAQVDNARWSKWGRTLPPKEIRRRRELEVAERKAREAADPKLNEPCTGDPETDTAKQNSQARD